MCGCRTDPWLLFKVVVGSIFQHPSKAASGGRHLSTDVLSPMMLCRAGWVPTEHGSIGASVPDLASACRETWRALHCAPVVAPGDRDGWKHDPATVSNVLTREERM